MSQILFATDLLLMQQYSAVVDCGSAQGVFPGHRELGHTGLTGSTATDRLHTWAYIMMVFLHHREASAHPKMPQEGAADLF